MVFFFFKALKKLEKFLNLDKIILCSFRTKTKTYIVFYNVNYRFKLGLFGFWRAKVSNSYFSIAILTKAMLTLALCMLTLVCLIR